ncbi:gamma-aminobutyric acid receptor subunit gamma-2-like, partial [Tropilaelaps mercedesae]
MLSAITSASDGTHLVSLRTTNAVLLDSRSALRGGKKVLVPSPDSPTKNLFIFNINGNKTGALMQLRIKQRITVLCAMIFRDFPADSHLCTLNIHSYSYNAHQQLPFNYVQYDQCSSTPLHYDGPSVLLESLISVDTCEFQQPVNGDVFNGICVKFFFQRQIFYQFLSNYLPSIFLVIRSFAPYLMSINSIADRISLSITLFQGIFTVFIRVRPICSFKILLPNCSTGQRLYATITMKSVTVVFYQ